MDRKRIEDYVTEGQGEVSSVKQFELIRAQRESAGRTFRVTREVFEHYATRLKAVAADASEREELGSLLGISLDQAVQFGTTRAARCGCGYEFRFVDHVKAALWMGVHTRDLLMGAIQGPTCFLTVDTEEEREMQCVSCGERFMAPHCCYTGSSYAYA